MITVICVLITAVCVCPTAVGAKAVKHTITFDVLGIGETPAPITVNDGDRYLYMRENDHGQNPTAEGYVFHCWVTTLDFEPDEVAMSNTAYYDETPIHEDMTLYAIWYKIVDTIDISVVPPVVGDVIGTDRYETEDFSFSYQSPRPTARAYGEGIRIKDSFWSAIGPAVFWLEDPNDRESTFRGTFERGKVYGVSAEVEPVFGYEFADNVSVTCNGKLLSSSMYCDYNLCIVAAPILCEEQTRVLGDIDGSGDVEATDVTWLQRYLARMGVCDGFIEIAADTDGDGEVGVTDATFIQRYLALLDVPYAIDQPIA